VNAAGLCYWASLTHSEEIEHIMSERPYTSRKPKFQRPRGKPGRREQQGWRPPHEIDTTVLYGWHPVAEALRNGKRTIRRLLATENSMRRLQEELGVPLPLEPEMVRPDEINRLLEPDAVHQGLYLEADPLPSPTIDTLSGQRVVLALDQITDPHNVGAIVRSAAAFGVEAIITTARHSPAATGVLAKSASGGLEHVPFMIVRNLADTLNALGERGFKRIGLDSEGDANIDELPLRLPLVLVLGSEGKGLRQRTRDCCDAVGRLEMPGAIKSLNVSNAAAISLFAVTKAVTSGASK
jgi:23S rRNA (guanosine2251-2'-O)-methyltransferase